MLKSGLSRQLFNAFISDYQSYSIQNQPSTPFVYVDTQGNMKVLTDFVEGDNFNSEDMFAVSVGEDGWMEVLELNSTN